MADLIREHFSIPTYSVVYKVTWPNGKIYVGSDVTDNISYFGSPNDARIAADFPTRAERRRIIIAREILRESQTVTRSEVLAVERCSIVALRANDPAVDYNISPRLNP